LKTIKSRMLFGVGSVLMAASAFGQTITVLHNFTTNTTSNADGAFPSAALIQAADGNLYGTTQYGGPYGQGTVFKVSTKGNFSTLTAFNGQRYSDQLFVTNIAGGVTNLFSTLSGGNPQASLIQRKYDGVLYGTTDLGFYSQVFGGTTNYYSGGGTAGRKPLRFFGNIDYGTFFRPHE
jgi:uncharacterized repeat protein (TIGR03803 family)